MATGKATPKAAKTKIAASRKSAPKRAASAVVRKQVVNDSYSPAVQIQVVLIMILAFFFLLFAVVKYS